MTAAPAVDCSRLSVGFRDASGPRIVLSEVTCSLPAGSVTLLAGRSGSGKSTLLSTFVRLLDPLGGALTILGQSAADWDPPLLRRRVALVLQQPVMFEGTVGDNLLVAPAGVTAPSVERAAEVLARIGLPSTLWTEDARTLSVGQRQRVALGRSLLMQPQVLLLDEPSSALDPESTVELAALLLELQEERALTLVVATHSPELAQRLGGTLLLATDGTVHTDVDEAARQRFFEGGRA